MDRSRLRRWPPRSELTIPDVNGVHHVVHPPFTPCSAGNGQDFVLMRCEPCIASLNCRRLWTSETQRPSTRHYARSIPKGAYDRQAPHT